MEYRSIFLGLQGRIFEWTFQKGKILLYLGKRVEIEGELCLDGCI